MALPDLTGQNIENTYQRVVTTEGGTYYDGTGSLLNIGTPPNNVTYVSTPDPVTPAPRQLAYWDSAGIIKANTNLTTDDKGGIIATTITASLSSDNIAHIGYLEVNKLRIDNNVILDRATGITRLGNSSDTKSVVSSPKLEVTDLNLIGEFTGSVDGGTF